MTFFISSPLVRGRYACADEADRVVGQLDVNHQQHPQSSGQAEEQGALYMDRVRDRKCQRISEDGRGLDEGHPVLLRVGGGLARVPGEVHPAYSNTLAVGRKTFPEATHALTMKALLRRRS